MRKVRTFRVITKTAPSLQPWKAYGDLLAAVQAAKKMSRAQLVDALNADARSNSIPRCTYSKRTTEYWEANPKNGRSSVPREYRAAHLYKWFKENVDNVRYAAQLAAIVPKETSADAQVAEHAATSQVGFTGEQGDKSSALAGGESCQRLTLPSLADIEKYALNILGVRPTPESMHLLGALFEPENPHCLQNRKVLMEWAQPTESTVLLNDPNSISNPLSRPRTREAFDNACAILLNALEKQAEHTLAARRFVTTNMYVGYENLSNWFTTPIIRKVMRVTRGVMQKTSKKHFELWRIFLVAEPERFAAMPMLAEFHKILKENLGLRIQVGIHDLKKIPAMFPPEFSDFLCVPGVAVSLSASPYYLLSTFSRESQRDRFALEHFSNYANWLVERVQDRNSLHAFEWQGGSTDRLREGLIQIAQR